MAMVRREFVATLLAVLTSTRRSVLAQRPGPKVQVYKDPTCGCCQNWVKHLQAHGFVTEVTVMQDLADFKSKHNVPTRVQSCHTAVVDDYVLEGHVPAADVQRLLTERPAILGLAVPGMPIGSPGMEVPNMKAVKYNVVSFDRQGQLKVYSSY